MATKEQQYVDRFDALNRPALERGGSRAVLPAVRALPYLGAGAADKLRPYHHRTRPRSTGSSKPIRTVCRSRPAAGRAPAASWAGPHRDSPVHKAYPDLIDRDAVFRGLHFLFGTAPGVERVLVATVGTKSKRLAYSSNRADFSFVPGVVVPGVLILKPDFPENMDDWPFLWGENEGTHRRCVTVSLPGDRRSGAVEEVAWEARLASGT